MLALEGRMNGVATRYEKNESLSIAVYHLIPPSEYSYKAPSRLPCKPGSISNIDDAEFHCNKTQVRKVISGVVGAASSVTSIQVANLLRLFKIPQHTSCVTKLLEVSSRDYEVLTLIPFDPLLAGVSFIKKFEHRDFWPIWATVYSAHDSGSIRVGSESSGRAGSVHDIQKDHVAKREIFANMLLLLRNCGTYHIVHSHGVSFFSTSPELSNKQRFEFFSRTIPSDHYQVKAMVDIVRRMGWSYVSILYEESNYGIKSYQAFEELEELLAKNNICIAVKEKLVKDSGVAGEGAYDNIVQRLLTKPRARDTITFEIIQCVPLPLTIGENLLCFEQTEYTTIQVNDTSTNWNGGAWSNESGCHEMEEEKNERGVSAFIKFIISMDLLKENKSISGAIIFGSDQEVAGVMRAVRRCNATGSFSWIGSDGWSARTLVSDGNELEVEGTLSVQPQANPVRGFEDYFLSLTVENNRRNPWFAGQQ
ncbi:hypothetical protein B566_EDAN015192 [Ephemera danica]|nr:hypothetical protein B566_EDAN015192 [Ephemera danica]